MQELKSESGFIVGHKKYWDSKLELETNSFEQVESDSESESESESDSESYLFFQNLKTYLQPTTVFRNTFSAAKSG